MYMAIAYGTGALITFGVFIVPIFTDWEDLTAKDFRDYFLFALAIGLLWPFVLILLAALAASHAYYSKKEKSSPDDEDD